jgi:hypothetical protein
VKHEELDVVKNSTATLSVPLVFFLLELLVFSHNAEWLMGSPFVSNELAYGIARDIIAAILRLRVLAGKVPSVLSLPATNKSASPCAVAHVAATSIIMVPSRFGEP